MSVSAPSPTSGTSGASPPPAPVAQGPPPSNDNLAPPVSPPPPFSPSSNSPPQPAPPASTKPNSPPLAPPPQHTNSPPPPPDAVPPLPTPPPPHNSTAKSSTPPPSIPSPPPKTPSSPPNASSLSSPPPSNTPPKVEQPPSSSPLSPLVVPAPPPKASQDSPPVVVAPILSPPAQPATPVVAKSPVVSPPSSVVPESPPSTSNPPPSTPATPVIPSPSLTPNTKPGNNVPQLTPPPHHPKSSSSNSSSGGTAYSIGNGVVVAATLAGVIVALVGIFFVILRKKKRRTDGLAGHYRPPTTFSAKSDGYYYEQANPTDNSAGSDAYYASRPPVSPSSAGTAFGGYGESSGMGNSKSWFTYEEISDMTHGFSQQHLIGEGGFGYVYKGWLPDGRLVAVKQLKAGSGQGEREFRAEVEIISRVHHRHLVSLVGYCISDHYRSLVYEFVPNKTLEYHLHGKGMPVLDWSKRVKIAVGSARGLAYLHEDCHPRIIHRDIKSANILLDDSFEAQVADFGLAKLANDTNTHVSTRVMGTFGYMAPEYASSGKLTDRSDVFSFGVVLLEVITGRKPVDPSQPLGDESLVEWARPLLVSALETGNFEGLADPRLENNYVPSEMFTMTEAAAACVRHSASKRPRMAQVARALDSAGQLSDLSNGVKFGQSTVFDSSQYSADIQKFRQMAFGSDDGISECGTSEEFSCRSSGQSSANSGEYHTREAPHKPLNPLRSGEFNIGHQRRSHELEPRASRRGSEKIDEGSYKLNLRGLV